MNSRLDRARLLLGSGDQALARRDFASALARYQEVMAMGLESWPIHVNAAQCYKRTGDLESAFRHFDRAFALKRKPANWSRGLPPDVPPSPDEAVSSVFVGNLVEQMRYLRSKGRLAWFDAGVERELEGVGHGLAAAYGPEGAGRLETTAAWANALVRLCPHRSDVSSRGDLISGARSIESIPLSGRPGDCFYVIDGLFERDALNDLLELLLESTFWFDARPHRRYLGAHLHDGLATPFVLDLAKALKAIVASLVGPVVIAQLWAFRYLVDSTGIDIHADQGDWNLNVWPVGSEHLMDDGGSGGMTIYDLRVPEETPFDRYNSAPDANRSLIETSGAKAHIIPYAGNRAVVFPSRYLHKTNAGTFTNSYEGRRINLTLICDELK